MIVITEYLLIVERIIFISIVIYIISLSSTVFDSGIFLLLELSLAKL